MHVDFLCFMGAWELRLSRVTELVVGQVFSVSPRLFQPPNDEERGSTGET